jgi:hypothetical protein
LAVAFGVGTLAAATASAEPSEAEKRTAAELEKIRQEPLLLWTFLKAMPKGADPHNHLDGAVYAETFIRVGGEDGFCVDPLAKAFTKSQPIKSGAEPAPVCEAGDVPAADVPKHQPLYGALVDSFSMRGFVPSEGVTGHDHFFGTFAKFGGTDPRHTGEFLHEVTNRAAAQNEQYLELMETPTWHRLNDITKGLAWRDNLGALRDDLLAKGLTNDIPAARAFWDQAETVRAERGRCGKPDEAPGCKVKTRYIYQVFRNTPKELVFAQTLFAFEYEDRPYELLKDMAAKGVLVEINLTSNDVILGIKGKHHPFPVFREHSVLVALSTDDEGVSRIDLTHEYVRAVETYGLTYADLKQIVRNSLEYSFLPGDSLWQDRGAYTRLAADCAEDADRADAPSSACAGVLGKSEKAEQQWELERRFRKFEEGFLATGP